MLRNMLIHEFMHHNIVRELMTFADVQTATNLTTVAADFGTDVSHSAIWAEKFKRHFPTAYNNIIITNALTSVNWQQEFQQHYLTEFNHETTRKIIMAVRDDDPVALAELFAQLPHERTNVHVLSDKDTSYYAPVLALVIPMLNKGLHTLMNNTNDIIRHNGANPDSANAITSVDISDYLTDANPDICNYLYREAALSGLIPEPASGLLAIMFNQPCNEVDEYRSIFEENQIYLQKSLYLAIRYKRPVILQYLIKEYTTSAQTILTNNLATIFKLAKIYQSNENIDILFQYTEEQNLDLPPAIFEYAITHGLYKICQKFINQNDTNLNTWYPDGSFSIYLPLYKAIDYTQPQIVELFINKLRKLNLWDINKQGSAYYSNNLLSHTLFRADRSNEILEILLQNGADLFGHNDPIASDDSVIFRAIKRGNNAALDCMLPYVSDKLRLLRLAAYMAATSQSCDNYLLVKLITENSRVDNPYSRNYNPEANAESNGFLSGITGPQRVTMLKNIIGNICGYIENKIARSQDSEHRENTYNSDWSHMFGGSTYAQKIEAAKAVLRVLYRYENIATIRPHLKIVQRMFGGDIFQELRKLYPTLTQRANSRDALRYEALYEETAIDGALRDEDLLNHAAVLPNAPAETNPQTTMRL